ncbi:hypothetical protein RIEGSTA812A_PEG_916 [invertebrate metagenome]|uniref:Uncharacterized protein n=1 Tax=invertebrate metagenome TaxID=1711999 RepID=A0A484H9C7_9ZZZZ
MLFANKNLNRKTTLRRTRNISQEDSAFRPFTAFGAMA